MNIEELAFKNIEELSQEDELILYDIIDFLQKDRKQWINQFSKTHNENVELQQKVNQLETNIDEAIEYIKSDPNVFYGEYLIDVETLLENECTDEIAGEIRFISTLLSILERGKE